jgi:hypothetical protein
MCRRSRAFSNQSKAESLRLQSSACLRAAPTTSDRDAAGVESRRYSFGMATLPDDQLVIWRSDFAALYFAIKSRRSHSPLSPLSRDRATCIAPPVEFWRGFSLRRLRDPQLYVVRQAARQARQTLAITN